MKERALGKGGVVEPEVRMERPVRVLVVGEVMRAVGVQGLWRWTLRARHCWRRNWQRRRGSLHNHNVKNGISARYIKVQGGCKK